VANGFAGKEQLLGGRRLAWFRGTGDAQPGVVGQVSQGKSFFGVHLQAASDQTLHLLAQLQLWEPCKLGSADLSVALEGDVAAHHVVEEDAQGPDGEALWPVSS